MDYIINPAAPQRPPNVEYTCMSGLFQAFEEIFLSSNGKIDSCCGHSVLTFDHHFFHLAAVTVSGVETLFMRDEKEKIRSLTDGFGLYEVDDPRARHLRSAYATLSSPDEVWENSPKVRVKWIYVKEFDSKPYQFSIALVTERPAEGNIIVPVSSFPCKKSDIKKWRSGTLIYPKNTEAAQ